MKVAKLMALRSIELIKWPMEERKTRCLSHLPPFALSLSLYPLLYPSLHFGMPFSQYLTYQGPQYLILKRRGVGLCWVKGI